VVARQPSGDIKRTKEIPMRADHLGRTLCRVCRVARYAGRRRLRSAPSSDCSESEKQPAGASGAEINSNIGIPRDAAASTAGESLPAGTINAVALRSG
jgi:hypothetical protein